LLAFSGTIGDLIRNSNELPAKDSGKIMMPAGVLDRLDSVIFVAPIIFFIYQILNYDHKEGAKTFTRCRLYINCTFTV
jgi:phosphatidate cytidylyltransferase